MDLDQYAAAHHWPRVPENLPQDEEEVWKLLGINPTSMSKQKQSFKYSPLSEARRRILEEQLDAGQLLVYPENPFAESIKK